MTCIAASDEWGGVGGWEGELDVGGAFMYYFAFFGCQLYKLVCAMLCEWNKKLIKSYTFFFYTFLSFYSIFLALNSL